MNGNDFEYCRQVLNASGGLSCSQIAGNYIEYHATNPLGFGAQFRERVLCRRGSWKLEPAERIAISMASKMAPSSGTAFITTMFVESRLA
jgi:hypothetical protein